MIITLCLVASLLITYTFGGVYYRTCSTDGDCGITYTFGDVSRCVCETGCSKGGCPAGFEEVGSIKPHLMNMVCYYTNEFCAKIEQGHTSYHTSICLANKAYAESNAIIVGRLVYVDDDGQMQKTGWRKFWHIYYKTSPWERRGECYTDRNWDFIGFGDIKKQWLYLDLYTCNSDGLYIDSIEFFDKATSTNVKVDNFYTGYSNLKKCVSGTGGDFLLDYETNPANLGYGCSKLTIGLRKDNGINQRGLIKSSYSDFLDVPAELCSSSAQSMSGVIDGSESLGGHMHDSVDSFLLGLSHRELLLLSVNILTIVIGVCICWRCGLFSKKVQYAKVETDLVDH